MRGFESSTVVNRAPHEVFVFLANLENDFRWRREWVEGTKTSQGPIGVGSTFRLVGKQARDTTEYELTEYEPDEITAWKATSGFAAVMNLRFRRTCEADQGGTRVTIGYEGELRGPLRLAGPILSRIGRGHLEADLPKLKAVMKSAPR